MPCYDGRETSGYSGGYDDGKSFQKREGRHNSDVAELLCMVMRSVPGNVASNLLRDKKLATWWEEHQERDRKKAEQERKEREEKTRRTAFERELKKLKQKHGVR